MANDAKSNWFLFIVFAIVVPGCGGGRPDFSLRSAPPEVAFASPLPTFTSTAALTVSISAHNPTGVKGVYALSGSQRWAAVQQGDGTWRVTVQLPVIGKNTITVWAEDTASPTPNSGQGQDAPYQLVQDVFYDPTAPSVSYDPAFASYSDERTLEVAVDANGVAKVPPEYSTGAKAGVLPGGDFYKSWSRLSAGPDLDVGELETTNANNIPVLRFAVPFNRNTDAPISTPTFVAHVACGPPCPEFPDATGSLMASATDDDQRALFDLPLATETIPALASIIGPAGVSITLTVSDAAGNTATVPGFNFVFHVVGPPLAIIEDTRYAAAANPDSVHAYHLADRTYEALWASGGQFPTNAVRLARYFITNPIPEPVALRFTYEQDPRGSWQAVETWNFFAIDEPVGANPDGSYTLDPRTSVAFAIDGFTFHNLTYWRTPYGTMTGTLTQGEYGAHPCGTASAGYPAHRMGDRSSRYVCLTDLFQGVPETAAFSSGDVSVWPYRIAPELQGQEREASKDATGQWFLAPPSSGGAPGTLVVYLARPVTAPRARALQWNAAAGPPGEAYLVNHYQTWDYESLRWLSFVSYSGYDVYVANRVGRYLARAQDNLHGTLTGTTHAYTGTSLLGEPVSRLSVALAREPLAVH